MIAIHDLPHINAVINAATVVVLSYGYSRIRVGDRDGHRRTMKVAVALGVAFLAIYFTYHANSGLAKFGGEGVIRPIYFTLLVIHVLAAVASAVLVAVAFFNALKSRFETHRKFARWAWPLWMFVSISGLVVYAMAIHIYPYHGA